MDEELLNSAKELGLEVNEDTTEEELSKLIEDAKNKTDDDDDDDKDKDKDKDRTPEEEAEYYKNELKKVIDQRDNAKKDKRSLKKKLDNLEQSLENAPDKESHENLKKELDELKSFKEEIEEQKEEEELKKKSELERTEIKYKKDLEALQKEMDSKLSQSQKQLQEKEQKLEEFSKDLENLRQTRLEKDIIRFASKHEAWSPEQIYKLTKDEFTYDKDLDKFVYLEKDANGKITDELSVGERIKNFLEDKENENLVKSSINTQSFNTNTNTNTSKAKTSSKKGKYDPKDQKLIDEAEWKGLEVEDLIAVKEARDKKLQTIEEKRQAS